LREEGKTLTLLDTPLRDEEDEEEDELEKDEL
jgi:hypothetical protein